MYEQLVLSVVPWGTLDHFQPVRGQKKMPGSGGKPIFSKCKEILRCSEDFLKSRFLNRQASDSKFQFPTFSIDEFLIQI